MELYEQILCEAIARDVIPGLLPDATKLVEMKCYQVIMEIYQVVADERLDDPECFDRIERIVTALDWLGIGGGGRHDF